MYFFLGIRVASKSSSEGPFRNSTPRNAILKRFEGPPLKDELDIRQFFIEMRRKIGELIQYAGSRIQSRTLANSSLPRNRGVYHLSVDDGLSTGDSKSDNSYLLHRLRFNVC